MPHRKRPDLDPATAALIQNINTSIRESYALVKTLSEQRTSLYRELRAEGWKVTHLAQLAGVSPQRMSKILDPDGSSRRKANPWDGWV